MNLAISESKRHIRHCGCHTRFIIPIGDFTNNVIVSIAPRDNPSYFIASPSVDAIIRSDPAWRAIEDACIYNKAPLSSANR